MRRTALILASVALAMLLVSGTALAINLVRCKPGSTIHNKCHGTNHPDKIRGTIGFDYIIGWASSSPDPGSPNDHDTIYGYATRDFIYGGNGRDRLYGGSGGDTIQGGAHVDKIFGEGGSDNLYDQVGRTGGSDWMSGGPDHDTMNGGFGADTMHGGRGPDYLRGYSGVDHLYGEAGSDFILADEKGTPASDTRDFVFCGDGSDSVFSDDEGVDVIAADCEEIRYETPE